MALHSKKDFAELCGLPTKNLATYIGRGKVVIGEGDLIDDKNSINKIFLAQRKSKASEQQVINHIKKYPTAKEKEDPAIPPSSDDDEGDELGGRIHIAGKMDTAKALEKLAYFRAEKTERETIRLDLDIQKKRGEVIPSDMVKPIFVRHNQFILTNFKNATDDILARFAKYKELEPEYVAELRGEMIAVINRAVADSVKMSIESVEDIVNEYKVKRGVGERTNTAL